MGHKNSIEDLCSFSDNKDFKKTNDELEECDSEERRIKLAHLRRQIKEGTYCPAIGNIAISLIHGAVFPKIK